jgi:hypothetical protein
METNLVFKKLHSRTGIRILNSLARSVTILKNDKPKLKQPRENAYILLHTAFTVLINICVKMVYNTVFCEMFLV